VQTQCVLNIFLFTDFRSYSWQPMNLLVNRSQVWGWLQESIPQPSLYEFSNLLSNIDSLRTLSRIPLTYWRVLVHSCPPISSSVASKIASKSEGGVRPRFGTHNFTIRLLNGQYINVVCPLDHPATEQTLGAKLLARRWGLATLVFATEDVSKVE